MHTPARLALSTPLVLLRHVPPSLDSKDGMARAAIALPPPPPAPPPAAAMAGFTCTAQASGNLKTTTAASHVCGKVRAPRGGGMGGRASGAHRCRVTAQARQVSGTSSRVRRGAGKGGARRPRGLGWLPPTTPRITRGQSGAIGNGQAKSGREFIQPFPTPHTNQGGRPATQSHTPSHIERTAGLGQAPGRTHARATPHPPTQDPRFQ